MPSGCHLRSLYLFGHKHRVSAIRPFTCSIFSFCTSKYNAVEKEEIVGKWNWLPPSSYLGPHLNDLISHLFELQKDRMTEWNPIWFVITRVISKIGRPRSGSRIFQSQVASRVVIKFYRYMIFHFLSRSFHVFIVFYPS